MRRPSIKESTNLGETNEYSSLAGDSATDVVNDAPKLKDTHQTFSFHLNKITVAKLQSTRFDRGVRSMSELIDGILAEWIDREEERQGNPIKPATMTSSRRR